MKDAEKLHEAQKHACRMAKERDEARVMADKLTTELAACDVARPSTPVGWSDTDWIKHLQDQEPHPLAGLHINQGSMNAAADAYEAEYNAALSKENEMTDRQTTHARQQAILKAQDEAIAALLDFASTVAGGSSWWDDVWAKHEAALNEASKGERND